MPFRILGIPILLDGTFLIVLPLFAWLIGSEFRHAAEMAGVSASAGALEYGPVPYLLGLVAAIGLFLSVLIHELGHSVVARTYDVKVQSITLWLLGGLAQFDRMPSQRGGEAVVAIAGPITSFALSAMFFLLRLAIPVQWPAAHLVITYLAAINLVLAVFNLLPALPLDGGRVLRSLLALWMGQARATGAAVKISRVLAVLMAAVGFVSVLSGSEQAASGMSLLLIAWFIFSASNVEARQAYAQDLLGDVRVEDVMSREVETVPPTMTAGEAMGRMLLEHRRGYPVADGGIEGMVSLDQLQGADPLTPVWRVMSRQVPTISRQSPAMEAMRRMAGEQTGGLVVTDDGGHVAGIVTSADLARVIRARMDGRERFV